MDVNILVRANERSHGPARTLLLALLEQGHTLLLSREMLVELAAALRYPRLQALYGMTEEQVNTYIQFLQGISEFVRVDPGLRVPIRDPKDIVVLQTAVSGDADVLCTLDRDFYASITLAFCAIMGIEVCSDLELLGKIRRRP